MPKVSVIVPVYDAEAHLARCVDSILRQEFTDLELILVDDGSTDGSPAICDAYAARDPRVRVIHKENEGVSVARNRGMAAAQGAYLQFLDADDWIPEDSTKLLVRAMEGNDVDMVIADFFRVVGERVSRKGDIDQEGAITREQYADCMLENPSDFYYGVVWNKLYRAPIVRDNHMEMDPNISWCEDFIFNMEYVLHCRSVYVLRVPVYYYVKTPGSLATQGASVASTVRMKLNVIEYYKRFYREMFDDKDYRDRQLDIYRFYTTFAGDDAIGPGTKRLGTERAAVRLPEDAKPGPLADIYLAQRLAERRLESAADQLDLTLTDVRAVSYLMIAGAATYEDLANYLDASTVTVRAEVARLAMKDIVSTSREVVDEDADGTGADRAGGRRPAKATVVRLAPGADDVTKAVSQASEDFVGLCTEGFSDEEAADYDALTRKAFANLRRVLVR